MEPQRGSVTRLIGQVRAGDESSARQLWEAYFQRLVGLARTKLQGAAQRASDEEDVALSAFASFCRGAEAGRFPDLDDRDNLWRLLLTITARKAAHCRRDQNRQKRGGNRVIDEASLESLAGGETGLGMFAGKEPTPEFAAQVAEECERLLGRLDTDELRRVALLKMEGYTNPEIAERLDCAPRTVDRRLQLIRSTWEVSAGP